MPPSSTTGAGKALTRRLPLVPKLKIRRPNKAETNSCVGAMSAVLNCWASSGHSVQGCIQVEEQLRMCMDTPRPKDGKKNTINYHLSRLYPKIMGTQRRK
ncbi:MAG: hypothetical protein M1829_005651 [Trizodia sp. TS-e1964]|nr:MAG: hypothetical protein M1829_005651 [Trizodia sp. TS-e1964]